MTEPPASPPLPEWVTKRDGRLVPFDADRISRALFAASESLGRPDAFAARELTDGVVHFLRTEADGAPLTTAQVAELVEKVVRELGQPALAQAFAARRKTPAAAPAPGFAPAELAAAPHSLALVQRAGQAGVAAYSLSELFSRDLAAAHRDGLLTLGGLDTPLELAGWLPGAPARPRLIELLEDARRVAGQFVALDGAEYLVGSQPPAEFVRELGVGLRATGLKAVLNLNVPTPPHWAGTLAEGPLFQGGREEVPPAEELADVVAHSGLGDQVRVDWHLGERDFAAGLGRFTPLVRRALEGAGVAFAFDRPRRPVPLAEGLDRQHPAVLLVVQLQLPRWLDEVRRRTPDRAGDLEWFLGKLGSLARMALSAGVQKRAFLRRTGRGWPAFLLDRARLVVVPAGLEQVEARLVPELLRQLGDVLRRDGQDCHLEACVEPDTGVRAAGRGTLTAAVEGQPAVEEALGLLQWAWKRTDFTRVGFARACSTSRQLLAPWERA